MEPQKLQKIKLAIESTLHGDPDAYTAIVTAYMQRLYRTAILLCGNASVAEDLVQETFIDGYLHLYELRDPEKIEGWLLRILRNKTVNTLARTKKTEPYDSLERRADKRTPESLFVAKETMTELHSRFDALSPSVRETAVLYFLEGLSMQEIVSATGAPLGTVKRRIHDARIKLRGDIKMTQNKSTLPDSFAEALATKIRDLENYTKTYGTVGFDSAYENVKELIQNLSSSEDVKEYSVKSAKIASDVDTKYCEEALAIYRKYGDVTKASDLLMDMCDKFWAWNSPENRYSYTRDRIIPELSSYPESDEKHAELGRHFFWMAYGVKEMKDKDISEVNEYLLLSKAEYEKCAKLSSAYPCATYGAAISMLKSLDHVADDRLNKRLLVTGETWVKEDGNVSYCSQPGFSYSYSDLDRYTTCIFYRASSAYDRYFFPVSVSVEAGAEEKIALRRGGEGIRRVIATDETVVTPAGTFENCLHMELSSEGSPSEHVWYCRGVGLVRITTGDEAEEKVLFSYEIKGGEGWLPTAVGNSWTYSTPCLPEGLYERNEYVIERISKEETEKGTSETIILSALNYVALEKDHADENSTDTLLRQVSELCDLERFEEAADILRSIAKNSTDENDVAVALYYLDFLDERIECQREQWRVCPSGIGIDTIEEYNGKLLLTGSSYGGLAAGPFGTRSEENRIFGVKMLSYLEWLGGSLWKDEWKPGYVYEGEMYGQPMRHTVTDGGTVITPAGTFENTLHLLIDYEVEGNHDDYFHYFYNNPESGQKEYWFAPGVGVVRHKCTWGKHLDSDALLSEYTVIDGGDEMMPLHVGNHWRYDEMKLTEENYIARRDYKILTAPNGKYLMGSHQFFTYCGTLDEYNAFKESLKNQ